MKSIWDYKVDQFLINEAPTTAPTQPNPNMQPDPQMQQMQPDQQPEQPEQPEQPPQEGEGGKEESQAQQLMALAKQLGLTKRGLLTFIRAFKKQVDKGLQPPENIPPESAQTANPQQPMT